MQINPEHRDIFDQAWPEFIKLFRNFDLSDEEVTKIKENLLYLLVLFLQTNEKINLTAIRDFEAAIWKHLYDSLLVLELEPLGSLLDWGTGGGFPGLPVAVVRDVMNVSDRVVLLDSKQKKVDAVNIIVNQLKSERILQKQNPNSVWSRGEQYISKHSFDTVTMRAVGPPDRILKWMQKSISNWVIFTGPNGAKDWHNHRLTWERRGFYLAEELSFQLPQQQGERFLLKLSTI